MSAAGLKVAASAPAAAAADASSPRSSSPATTTQATQQQVNEQSWHKLLWIPLMIVVPTSLYSISSVIDQVTERQAYMEARPGEFDWTYPKLSDLWVTFYGLIVLLVLRVTLCKYVFTPLGDWILPTVAEKKGKWTEAARADRVQRFSVCIFKLCFFIYTTVYGYITLKPTSWLPPELGGSGVISTAWNGWPYSAITDSVKRYYLLSLSYHVHSLVFHILTARRNDFVEMTLHHICAVLLVVFSYYVNWVRLGSVVLFLHDIADVWAYSVKAVVDTKYTALTLSAYAGLLIAWGYTRLYVYPMHVIKHAMIPGMDQSFVWITSYFMIWTLQLLHVYWYILFLIMGYRFAVSGKTVDIQQKAGEADGSYVDYHKKNDDENGAEDGVEEEQEGAAPAVEQPRPRKPVAQQQQQQEEDEPVAAAAPLRTRSQKKSKRAE